MKYKNLQNGFIALTSTLILSAVLVMLMITTSTSSFFTRFDALYGEFKRVSLGLSESCLNIALLKIAQNYNYLPPVGGEIINVGIDTCTIKSITCLDNPCEDTMGRKKLEIETGAKYPSSNGSWSTNKIKISAQNPAISTSPTLLRISVDSWNDL